MNSPLKQAAQCPVHGLPTMVSYSCRKSNQWDHWQPSQSQPSMIDRHSMAVPLSSSFSRGYSFGAMYASGTAWLNHTWLVVTFAACSTAKWE